MLNHRERVVIRNGRKQGGNYARTKRYGIWSLLELTQDDRQTKKVPGSKMAPTAFTQLSPIWNLETRIHSLNEV